MKKISIRSYLLSIFLYLIFVTNSFSQNLEKVNIIGNQRIADETILMFSDVSINQEIDEIDLNKIIKNLYETSYFKLINTKIDNRILIIEVVENPIIGNINYEGVKAQKIIDFIKDNSKLKRRSSYTEFNLLRDKEIIQNSLRTLGYYFSNIDAIVEDKGNNIVDITYTIEIGKKAKIKKIKFTGNKIYKNSELKRIIVSEEYKPWKFISGKKYLNEDLIKLDNRLLKNFFLNNGFYNISINSSYAKLLSDNEFELVFNINPGEKFYFNDLKLKLPIDFNDKNYSEIYDLFSKIKGKPYSINIIENILDEIDKVSIGEQFVSTKASVIENINDNNINLDFIIEETKKIIVEKINIYGNFVTNENVIRNQFELDEGDPFNDILLNKTTNNLKSLNFFNEVSAKVSEGKEKNSKIINIELKEKPTGEITAGAGFGTSGGSIGFGVRENNYLGKGIRLDANLTLREDSVKGLFSVNNPNFKNSDKSVYTTIQSSELNKLTDFGYKSNKTGLKFGTKFEYLSDLELGFGLSSFYEKIETDSSASARQKKQEGDYFDNHLSLIFDYDKRDQKFKTTDGIKSYLSIDTPIISETNSFSNTFILDNYSKLFSSNIIKSSFYFGSSNSLTGEDIKLSERINLPSNRLRGFEYGKVGPKDGNDFIGGNFVSSLNFSSTLPQILKNVENTDFLIFMDVGNVWGVDYNSSLDKNDNIRSSIGIGLDWFSVVGPMNFTLAQPISKNSSDVTETFRFNLGTTF
ncbi:outer membrane protein assembly factor BamA [Candidatus Pelagibacter communis]|uniref:outer membrane protein assembly factor BamA n=1 Tax=Pelagibacter ubique TaxID=198252 RepID=UPI00094BFBF5|nr:outer membrane protein assembly factor BamA [Candidatus Pelagibacter ubique]